MTAYLPQYITLEGSYVVTPPTGYASWQVITPGTGYVTADIGKTVTLVGGSPITAATATISAVAGGGITGFAESTAQGYYTGLYTGDPLVITGGTGSGCTVKVGAETISFVTSDTQLGSSLSQCTLAFFCNGFIFNPVIQMRGYHGGLALTLNSAQQEGIEDPILLLTLQDATATTIFDGQFSPATVSINTPTPSTSFFNVLLSFDTAAHSITVYVNDIAWVLTGDSAGWTPGNVNPVANPYGSLPNWTLKGSGGTAQFYVRPSFTDFTDPVNRRVFLNTDNTPVDPATLPAAPVNLYLLPGDMPDGFKTNHGTGGVWTVPGAPPNWVFFELEYHGVASTRTPVHTPVTLDLSTTGYGTVRPGAGLTFTMSDLPTHGVASIVNNVLTYTPNAGYIGKDWVGLRRAVNMPTGFVSPLTWGVGVGWGASATIAVGLAVATETSRTMIELETLPYLVDEPAEEFQLPLYCTDRPVVAMSVYDNYDGDNNYIDSDAAFAELAPQSKTQTNYGDQTNLADGSTFWFSVWGDRIIASDGRNPAGSNDFAYIYAPYAAGVAAARFAWTPVFFADIGFSSNNWYMNGPLAITWQGLTNPVAMAFDYDPATSRHDAYVVSHEGAQKITGFMTLPYHANDPILIIPDAVNRWNWVLTFTFTTGWVIYCVSAVDGSTISQRAFTFGGPDVEYVLTDGITGTGAYSVHKMVATPHGFVFYGPINRFQQSSNQNVSHRKGSFIVTLTPDCSSYTLRFLAPRLDDPNAVTVLNRNQPNLDMATDAEGQPYAMSYSGYTGGVLSFGSGRGTTLRFVSGDVQTQGTPDVSFPTQFTISLWACFANADQTLSFTGAGDVEFTTSLWLNPNQFGFASAFSGTFTASDAGLRPKPVHVLFSIDFAALVYCMYWNDVARPEDHSHVVYGPGNVLNDGGWSVSNPGGVADVWIDARYVDFTDVANRRKFIAEDGTPVDLGARGHLPFGASPRHFLHLSSGDPPVSFVNNLGYAGPWEVTDDPLSLDTNCTPGAAPAPLLGMSELTCEADVVSQENTVSLRWSDTRGASFGNAIVRSLGDAGQYDQDISWRRLGQSRDRVFEISWSTTAPDALNGVFLLVDVCVT